MALDAIELVRAAELKAEETARAASQKASQLISNAEQEAALILAGAQDQTRSDAADKMAAAHEESRVILERAAQDLGAEMQALRQAACARQPEAVRVVLQALV